MRKRPLRRHGSVAVELRGVDEGSERMERRFEVPVLVAALLVIPVIAVEQTNPGEPWRTLAVVTNWLIWFVFLAELVAILAVVPDRWRWLRSHRSRSPSSS